MTNIIGNVDFSHSNSIKLRIALCIKYFLLFMAFRLVLFFCISGFTVVFSQNSINSSGGNISSSSGNVSYSVGQLFYKSTSHSEGSVSEGVQQAYTISEISSVEILRNNWQISLYPNPTDNFIYLKHDLLSLDNLKWQLFDIQGRLLTETSITINTQTIDLSDFSKAVYFLKVTDNNQEFKTFKIVKN
jgi:hypothetical protein